MPLELGASQWRQAARDGAAAVTLLSGGLDSGVALAEWLHGGGRCELALTADYGQRAALPEMAAARRLAARLQVPWRSLDLRWLAEPGRQAGSALLDRSVALPDATPAAPGDAASAGTVWVPARNIVLCAAAAAFAEAAAARWVLTGFNAEEAVTFADNSSAFVAAFNVLLVQGCRHPVMLAAPTLELDKVGIVAAARRHGLGAGDFWSCYESGVRPCDRCESCARAARAWGAA